MGDDISFYINVQWTVLEIDLKWFMIFELFDIW